jgi:hypothetical protein
VAPETPEQVRARGVEEVVAVELEAVEQLERGLWPSRPSIKPARPSASPRVN